MHISDDNPLTFGHDPTASVDVHWIKKQFQIKPNIFRASSKPYLYIEAEIEFCKACIEFGIQVTRCF